MKIVLEAKNVSYTYPGGIKALNKASIKIAKNKVTAILGPNGSGKTTLMLVLAGLLKPDEGEVILEGRDVFKENNYARRKIGMVFQDPDDQLFNLSVRDELIYGLKQLGINNDEIESRINRIADKFKIRHLLNRSPFELSYGEKKIVLTAAIVVTDPEILLFDEPLSNLSKENKTIIYNIINEYINRGKTIVLSTNDSLAAIQLSDYIFILRNGEIVFKCSTKELINNLSILENYGVENPVKLCEKIMMRKRGA